MKPSSLISSANTLVLGILGILGALLVLARLAGSQIPLVAGDRASFVALLIIGITMCALGPLRHIQPTEWVHPMNVVAIVLGSSALLLGIAVLAGIPIPLISSDRTAFVILAIIILSKVTLVGLHHTFLER